MCNCLLGVNPNNPSLKKKEPKRVQNTAVCWVVTLSRSFINLAYFGHSVLANQHTLTTVICC